MSIYTFFVLQPYAFVAHNIHITDINNSEYNNAFACYLHLIDVSEREN